MKIIFVTLLFLGRTPQNYINVPVRALCHGHRLLLETRMCKKGAFSHASEPNPLQAPYVIREGWWTGYAVAFVCIYVLYFSLLFRIIFCCWIILYCV
jgi:hypothetical protein